MHKVVIIGGGAAGMMAALASSKNGNNTIILEKNSKLGRKIYITGKGRCNLTNDITAADFINNVVSNPKFLMGAINKLSPKETMALFKSFGLSLTVERGNRVFPSSNKASDVTATLEKQLIKQGVDIRLNTTATSIETCVKEDKAVVCGVRTNNGFIDCDSVIVCTGGVSYPLTGSTGDGYVFAKKIGHNIVETKAALTGIELKGNDFSTMQGLNLKNVGLSIKNGNKTIYNDFGEMLFTHFGVSGPIVLSASSIINRMDFNNLSLEIDLKPALDIETLNKRLLREFNDNQTKQIENVFRALLPKSLIQTVLSRAKLNSSKRCCEITKEERAKIIEVLKGLSFRIKCLRPIDEAIVTAGGVCVKQINPKTMESKLVCGLFFAGEVIDVDAFTGGFNLQIAFSTGYCAGNNA